jgi:hypothetical protein
VRIRAGPLHFAETPFIGRAGIKQAFSEHPGIGICECGERGIRQN